jgi:2-polyprenyl-3-methyl-5-hydroxy-6-metoxy-1,4-benzoquinol methylase
MIRRAGRWNHNIHYYPLILAAVPAGCQRVLDVGCGEGMLARELADLVPSVSGIDADANSIDLARREDPAGQLDLIAATSWPTPLRPARLA